MRWTYDANADAFYLYLTGGTIVRQTELHEGLIADLDADGTVVGVEVIGGMRPIDVNGLQALGLSELALQTLAAFAAQPFPSVGVRPSAPLTDQAISPSEAGLSVEPPELVLSPV
jgi:uncharacterized protein YuzE